MKSLILSLSSACAFTLVLATVSQAAGAVTIVSQTGYDQFGWSAGTNGFCISSWTQSRPYVDVSIVGRLYAAEVDSGTAYLTTRIGPGTTLADQVAAASFLFPTTSNPSDVVLFSGLDLAPGTYYLSVAGGLTAHATWFGTVVHAVTTDSGVTHNGNFIVDGPNIVPFAPASRVTTAPDHIIPIFSVTGTAVPEPSVIMLIVCVSIGCMLLRWPSMTTDSRNICINESASRKGVWE